MHQDSLQLRVELEDDRELFVTGLDGREAISDLFWFDIDVACEVDDKLPESAGIGSPATLVFQRGDVVLRRVHGVIEQVRHRVDCLHEGMSYRLKLVPTVSRALRIEAPQVFLNLSVPALITKKLELLGLVEKAVSMVDTSKYPVREFVSQLQETDYAFICRLAEHLGISFFFEHLDDHDQIVFADDNAHFTARAIPTTVQIADHLGEPNTIARLDVVEHAIPSNFVAYDYNYRRPDLGLVGRHTIDDGNGGGVLEYGTHIKDEDAGTALAAIRAEERLCRRRRFFGDSSIVNLTAGGRTVLEAHRETPETALLITAVNHRVGRAEGSRAELVYENSFEAVETTHTFRPERRTPRPNVAGFVTGTVQGLPNAADNGASSPVLDPDGRYWVQLHFDTILGDPTKAQSHRMRMNQPFGGTGHGMHFPLRPGTEVAVAFANGDPDRPVILGALPNAHTRTPVTAANATQNRITTASGAIFEISERK